MQPLASLPMPLHFKPDCSEIARGVLLLRDRPAPPRATVLVGAAGSTKTGERRVLTTAAAIGAVPWLHLILVTQSSGTPWGDREQEIGHGTYDTNRRLQQENLSGPRDSVRDTPEPIEICGACGFRPIVSAAVRRERAEVKYVSPPARLDLLGQIYDRMSGEQPR